MKTIHFLCQPHGGRTRTLHVPWLRCYFRIFFFCERSKSPYGHFIPFIHSYAAKSHSLPFLSLSRLLWEGVLNTNTFTSRTYIVLNNKRSSRKYGRKTEGPETQSSSPLFAIEFSWLWFQRHETLTSTSKREKCTFDNLYGKGFDSECALCVSVFVCRYLPQIHHCCSGYTSNADGYGRTATLQYNLITKWWSDQVEPIDIIVSAETWKICWQQSTRFVFTHDRRVTRPNVCVCMGLRHILKSLLCIQMQRLISSHIFMDYNRPNKRHPFPWQEIGRSVTRTLGFSIQINIWTKLNPK